MTTRAARGEWLTKRLPQKYPRTLADFDRLVMTMCYDSANLKGLPNGNRLLNSVLKQSLNRPGLRSRLFNVRQSAEGAHCRNSPFKAHALCDLEGGDDAPLGVEEGKGSRVRVPPNRQGAEAMVYSRSSPPERAIL
jgi:hypothetical protein